MSKYLGTNHNETYLDYSSLNNLIDSLSQIYDEPFADSSQLPTILLSIITKKVTVALSGDGGDELFGGYYRYFLAEKFKKLIFMQPKFFKSFLKNIIRVVPYSVWSQIEVFCQKVLEVAS